ncbi:MAG: phenylalanine--tRNA ligase subunit beta [Candidatus Diapherotrites archaeon]|nr:phenylalanine--tRNA ligase subunit beta [Candidatus Diapherotrites archaeon]
MPSLEASKKDLEKLVKKKFACKEELETALEFAKCELDSIEGDKLSIGVKDTNRPDLLSTEGIARELRSRYTKDRGVPKYMVKKSGVTLIVDKNVAKIRPCIAAALIKNIKVTEDFLIQMIQLQEKVCLTFGKRRKEAAIGLYDWKKLKAPMHYKAFKLREKKFIPLEYKVEMDLEEILLEHPKGKEYKHLLEGFDKYPLLLDSKGAVASMPPIINSQLTGKVSEETKEVLVEVTGYTQETVNTALDVMVSAIAERGFSVYSVKIKYPDKTIVTPTFKPKKVTVNLGSVTRLTGLDLTPKQAKELLEKARYNVRTAKGKLLCEYPSYRQDILHEVDVIEDVLISTGYNKIEPAPVELACTGSESSEALAMDSAREICVGMGLQEVLTFTMTSREKQAKKIGLKENDFVEIANPVSINYEVFRKNILPELLDFLGKNKHCLYPQKIFEIGKCLELDESKENKVREPVKLCVVLSGKGAEFTVIKSALDALCKNMNWEHSIEDSNISFLEKGKQGKVTIGSKKGFFGELNKKTLEEFGLEMPTACFEIET